MNNFIRKSMLDFILKNQKSFVILDAHKPSPAYNITFLQSNLSQLPNHYQQYFSTFPLSEDSSKILKQFITTIQKNQLFLGQIQSQEIRPSILQDPNIRQMSDLFTNLKLCLQQQVNNCLVKPTIRPENLTYLSGCVNVMQFQLWNKYMMYASQEYSNMSTLAKSQFIAILNSYLSKYSYIFTNRLLPYKFIMRETHIQNLIDFTFFFKITQQPNLLKRRENQSGFGIQLELLKNRIIMINKVSKSININLYVIRQQFVQLIPQLIENIQFMSLQDLLQFYHFYAKLSLDSKNFVESFQKCILDRVNKISSSQTYLNIITTKKILHIWKLQSRYNNQIMNQYIMPIINHSLKQYKNGGRQVFHSNTWNEIAYSLICCDYPKLQTVQQILNMLSQQLNLKNKTYQISTQYLKFKKLKQNKQNQAKLLQNQLSKHQKQKLLVQPIQFNIVQKFWEEAIKKIIPSSDIYRSKYISVYQIDVLIKYKGYYFAIQVQGGHYRAPNSASLSGKKKIKKQILRCFGIRVITINCEQLQPKLIMRFKKSKEAEKYILSKLENQIKSQTQASIVQK